jgi:hypothetical protein
MQADIERLLARLLTDIELRERFIADPVGIAIAAGLSAQETETIARVSVQDLRVAGHSYARKRDAVRNGMRKTWILRWFRAQHS